MHENCFILENISSENYQDTTFKSFEFYDPFINRLNVSFAPLQRDLCRAKKKIKKPCVRKSIFFHFIAIVKSHLNFSHCIIKYDISDSCNSLSNNFKMKNSILR